MEPDTCGSKGSKGSKNESSSLLQGLKEHAKEFYEATPEQHKQ